ncbi:7075_t:CDS:1, partial [Ambispora gerdemannii]
MTTIEKTERELNDANVQLEDAKRALQVFKEGEGKLLVTLRLKELREDINAKEQAALKRLADEETRLTAEVTKWSDEVLKSREDLRRARAQLGNDFVTRALGT